MGLGFRKCFKIAPGVRFNVSGKGIGISAGVKGRRHSVNSRGQHVLLVLDCPIHQAQLPVRLLRVFAAFFKRLLVSNAND